MRKARKKTLSLEIDELALPDIYAVNKSNIAYISDLFHKFSELNSNYRAMLLLLLQLKQPFQFSIIFSIFRYTKKYITII